MQDLRQSAACVGHREYPDELVVFRDDRRPGAIVSHQTRHLGHRGRGWHDTGFFDMSIANLGFPLIRALESGPRIKLISDLSGRQQFCRWTCRQMAKAVLAHELMRFRQRCVNVNVWGRRHKRDNLRIGSFQYHASNSSLCTIVRFIYRAASGGNWGRSSSSARLPRHYCSHRRPAYRSICSAGRELSIAPDCCGRRVITCRPGDQHLESAVASGGTTNTPGFVSKLPLNPSGSATPCQGSMQMKGAPASSTRRDTHGGVVIRKCDLVGAV